MFLEILFPTYVPMSIPFPTSPHTTVVVAAVRPPLDRAVRGSRVWPRAYPGYQNRVINIKPVVRPSVELHVASRTVPNSSWTTTTSKTTTTTQLSYFGSNPVS